MIHLHIGSIMIKNKKLDDTITNEFWMYESNGTVYL